MGKKNKERNNTVTTTEKKTSIIDKLKFMQKNKKPDQKKQSDNSNNIVSQTPISFSTSTSTQNSHQKQIPNFFMKVQHLVMNKANSKISKSQKQTSTQQKKIQLQQTTKNVEYESWEKQKVIENKQQSTNDNNENQPVIQEKTFRYNFS